MRVGLPRFASEQCWARRVPYPAYLPQLGALGSASGVVIWLWLRLGSRKCEELIGLSRPNHHLTTVDREMDSTVVIWWRSKIK
ncbi:hypothetical protein FB390_5971 [Nocardia bhagyanarayanae]|uniref:Uncharacterized protein n=1 Tax=Nocardia bhagyanarayanae TaxID=1215925 RepID=A0A543EW49_9NOCA|nr:hypothetical protein FB390_5971 [Nocardia bhagyanarayanae]